MRPTVTIPESGQYECIACGNRVSDPEDRHCASCGGSLRNLDHSRDV